MGAYRLHTDDGRYVDIHDAELDRFLDDAIRGDAATTLGADAAYVGWCLARMLRPNQFG